MANSTFQADIDRIVVNTDRRLNMVMKQSLQITIDEAQTPVAKGGKMRVDTGFLRASGQASLNGMPTGPGRGDAKETYTASDTQITATIGQLKFGGSLWFGYTANYARYREAYDGFLASALQNWQKNVSAVVEEARRRFS